MSAPVSNLNCSMQLFRTMFAVHATVFGLVVDVSELSGIQQNSVLCYQLYGVHTTPKLATIATLGLVVAFLPTSITSIFPFQILYRHGGWRTGLNFRCHCLWWIFLTLMASMEDLSCLFHKLLPAAFWQPHFDIEFEQLFLLSVQDPFAFFLKVSSLVFQPQSGLTPSHCALPCNHSVSLGRKVSNGTVHWFTFLLFVSVELHTFKNVLQYLINYNVSCSVTVLYFFSSSFDNLNEAVCRQLYRPWSRPVQSLGCCCCFTLGNSAQNVAATLATCVPD